MRITSGGRISYGRIVIATIILMVGASPLIPAYNVTTFSDGSGEKILDLSFSADGTLFLSIPRATNLSDASLLLTGSATTIGSQTSTSDFSGGSTSAIILKDDLSLATKNDWWNNSWQYRLPIQITASEEHSNITLEKELNLSALLAASTGFAGAIDSASLRIVERAGNGALVSYNLSINGDGKYLLPTAVKEYEDFNKFSNAHVFFRWSAPGKIGASQDRNFELYFNSLDNPGLASPSLPLDFPEIIYSNSQGGTPRNWMYKNTNGAFSANPSETFEIGPSFDVAVNDVNSDGYRDIVYSVYKNLNVYNATSQIYYGCETGIDNSTTTGIGTLGAYDAAIDDFNNDGYKDIVFASYRNFSRYNISSMLYYGNQFGFNATPDELFNTTGAAAIATGDLNQDGWDDIIFACERNQTTGNIYSQIYFGGPSGFNEDADVFLPTQAARGVAISDLNKDGWLDIIFANNRNTTTADLAVPSSLYYGGASGLKANPDVHFDTTGAMDVAVADLNLDGWLDVVFANYADGASTRTLSYAFFGSASGFDASNPNAWFQTAYAYGVDVGDVNLDGTPDVAFANNFDGITYAINSTIFYGPCVGLKSAPNVKLPTIGATKVEISDMDRYYMSGDKNPPILKINGVNGSYVQNGTFQSENIVIDEKVLSASATWNATIPAEPAGCAVNVSLSNDAGATWTQVEPGAGINFTAAGRSLRYKVELFSDRYGVGTPVFQDITITYTKESYPYNVTLDVNSDGRSEWSWPGKFNTTAVLNETTMGLKTYLEQVVPRTGSGLFQVLLKFSSEKPGVLRVHGVNITGNYRPEAIQELPDFVMTENIPLPNAFNVKNYFRHQDDDPLQYSTRGNRNVLLNISENGSVTISTTPNWYGAESFLLRATDDAGEWAEVAVNVEVRHVLQPPRFIADMPNVTVEEGDTVFSAFNLLEYVFDPDNPKTSLIFSVADVSNPNVSVSMDVNDNIEVRSKAGWDGTAVVKIKVSDGELSAIASFNVTVVRHNRPPVIGQLPPIQIEQDETLERSFNLLNFTTDTDTPRANLTFRIDDNTNPRSGVTVTPDGWVNIRPDRGWSGTAIIVVNVSDGEYGVRASFTVTVTPKTVTPPPVKETDNTLMYILILLVVVLIVVFVADVGLRMRRTGPPPAQAPAASPEPGEARSAAAVKKVKVRPAAAEPPAEVPPIPSAPIEVQAEQPAPEAPTGPAAPEAPAEAPPQPAAEAPAGEYYQPPAEAVQAPDAGGMAPVPPSPEVPPERVPDLTPDGFTEAGQAPGEPETMDMDQPAQPEQPAYGAPEPRPEPEPPAPEIGAGEVEQGPSSQSAASLLAALQKPVPKLESEAASPPPAPEAPAPPAPPAESQEIGERIEAAMVSKATESEHAATEVEQKDVKPLTRVRCAGCRAAIPIFSAQRPLVVTCPQCGRMGMLK